MSSEEIVDAFYHCLKSRDRDGLVAVLDPGIRVTYHSRPGEFPWSGEFSGIDGFDRFLEALREHLEIIHVDILKTIADERHVVKQCRGAWRYLKSGHVVEGDMVNIFTVSGDRITAYDVHADTAAFRAGLSATSRGES